MSFEREFVKETIAELAKSGVFLGTSSWKYRGWCNQLYDEARYVWRGKFAESRFERNCLSEYAEVFKTVCVDAAYYKFPEHDQLKKLADAVTADFQFGFKITDAITIRKFPNFPRFGLKAGAINNDFLNADLFVNSFLNPCETIREKVGVLIFEFSKFSASEYAHGRDFISDLENFLAKLPAGWPYALEMRNRHWLQDDYFACLAKYKVSHVFNSWDAMPPISEQVALAASRTNPDLVAARLLLKPNRRYKDAVKMFKPYDKVLEINDEARASGAALIKESKKNPKRKTFLFVNNRLEGNALETIAAILEKLEANHS